MIQAKMIPNKESQTVFQEIRNLLFQSNNLNRFQA